jgi:hypothetical protein
MHLGLAPAFIARSDVTAHIPCPPKLSATRRRSICHSFVAVKSSMPYETARSHLLFTDMASALLIQGLSEKAEIVFLDGEANSR